VTRQATLLLAVALASLVGAVLVGAASAQDAATPGKVRVVTVAAQEDNAKCPKGEGPCWDVPILVVAPGDALDIKVVLEGTAQPHDFRVKHPDGEKKVPDKPVIGGTYDLNLTFPESAKTLDYFCSVHPKTMVGKLSIASALGATEEKAVPELGVHFLSYWVGLIAFMLLFVVYGATFFLFKYNETPATTDQWERAGEGAPDFPRRFGPGATSLLAIVLAGVVIAAIIFLARR
jgi:hypothetical protein